MIISKAPVRLSLGGGGTDFPDYYDKYGGAVLSLTIDKYFYSILQVNHGEMIELESSDYQLYHSYKGLANIKLDDALMIPKAVLNHFEINEGLHLSLKSDIPPGSGLGLSGAVTNSMVQLISTYKKISLNKKKIAELASFIEIDVLKRPIGMQDQYASAFGRINFIEFRKNSIEVKPIELNSSVYSELEESLMLFYTGISRNSADILTEQRKATRFKDQVVIESLHRIKEIAYRMREVLVVGDFAEFSRLLHESWEYKKQLSPNITNSAINKYYNIY